MPLHMHKAPHSHRLGAAKRCFVFVLNKSGLPQLAAFFHECVGLKTRRRKNAPVETHVHRRGMPSTRAAPRHDAITPPAFFRGPLYEKNEGVSGARESCDRAASRERC